MKYEAAVAANLMWKALCRMLVFYFRFKNKNLINMWNKVLPFSLVIHFILEVNYESSAQNI